MAAQSLLSPSPFFYEEGVAVFPTCFGVDVHKSFLVATIIKTPMDSLQPSYQKKRFSTFNLDLNRFAEWLHENGCLDVCMESTGKYWVPVFNIFRMLRELNRCRYKLTSMKSSEKNRFQNAFTVCNVALDSVVSDMFGKSATAITGYLTSDEDFDAQHCVSLLQRSLKKKADDVLEAIEGYQITSEPKMRISIIHDHLHYTKTLIERVDTCINTIVDRYEGYIALLCTIPGVDRSSAITIISEIGTDMVQFGSSRRLCCWAGLTPGNNESAGKKKSVRISRAGVYLKPAMVLVAHAAVKDEGSSYHTLKHGRIQKRRGKKRAIIAISRMILTAVYSMLTTGEIWNPIDPCKVDMPEHLKKKQFSKAVKQAVPFLETQGLTVLNSA